MKNYSQDKMLRVHVKKEVYFDNTADFNFPKNTV